jgi:rhodanese-related sulfurtransferase
MMQAGNNDNVVSNELFNAMMDSNSVQIIDIRDQEAVKQYPLSRARHIPMMTLVMFYDELLDKNTTYYIHSELGQRQDQVTKILTLNGYNVIKLERDLELVTS